jgi:hypothetical protein
MTKEQLDFLRPELSRSKLLIFGVSTFIFYNLLIFGFSTLTLLSALTIPISEAEGLGRLLFSFLAFSVFGSGLMTFMTLADDRFIVATVPVFIKKLFKINYYTKRLRVWYNMSYEYHKRKREYKKYLEVKEEYLKLKKEFENEESV